MQKPTYLKNQANAAEKRKFVFKALEKPSNQPAGGGGAAPGSLGEQMEKKYNTNLNVDVKFNDNHDAMFIELGEKAQKKNPDLSAESIKLNMTDTLVPGKTLEDVWAYLQSNKCETAAIVEGHLRFFAGPAGTKEISLSEFFKPRNVEIGGEGTVTHEYLLRRQEMMSKTMQSLQALRGELPEIPPNKTN